MPDVWVSVKQLCRRYFVHRMTIKRWVDEDKFPKPIKINARLHRWRLEDVEAWELRKGKGGER